MFPSPRIPTEKIPESRPHIERGDHKRLYRFSPSDYLELAAVFNGPHPETGEELEVVDKAPEGFPPIDLPPQEGVFAPDYAPEEIAEIARKLRNAAGLSDEPTGVVANDTDGVMSKARSRAPSADGDADHAREQARRRTGRVRRGVTPTVTALTGSR
jgi:hypothetical protein